MALSQRPIARARRRLASLWISHIARVMADAALGIFVLLELTRASGSPDHAWQLVAALLLLPAILLAPVCGSLSNSLSKPLVLFASAGYCTLVVGLFGFLHGPWPACCALIGMGAAVNGPARAALLPAASAETRAPPTRVCGWMETGTMAGVIAGILLGAAWHGTFVGNWEAALVLVASLNLAAMVAALPARFAGDVLRPESIGPALAGFFRDCGRIFRIPQAPGCLAGAAAARSLVTGIIVAAVGVAIAAHDVDVYDLLAVGAWVLGGIAFGCLLAALQPHPTRVLGLVPFGVTGLAIGLIIAAAAGGLGPTLSVWLGVMIGLIHVPLAATYQAALPADARGNGTALYAFTECVLIAATAFGMNYLGQAGLLSPSGQLWLIAVIAIVAVPLSFWMLLRQAVELVVELAVWPMYRIRAVGPGIDDFPSRGPLLVVANHSSWLDPVWVAKALPRWVIPMMTSVFYDLPVLRRLMKLGGVIRVQASRFRREVPEISQAVAALDRGECVLLFPEGWMRRRDDQPVKQFGQGIARLLKERPQTPVLVCWIEGGWGSFFSWRGGPPTKNKRLDFFRRIRIGVEAPRVMDPALIADQRALRAHLMQACLDARRLLGLEVLPLNKSAAAETEPDEERAEAQREPHIEPG